jgi:hypothetical protein
MNHPHLGDIESWLFASGRSVPDLSTFATTKHLNSIAAASIDAIPWLPNVAKRLCARQSDPVLQKMCITK